MKKLFIAFIKLYQYTAPARRALYISIGITPDACKHSPSCSNYSLEVINQYGTIRGLVLALKRLSTCYTLPSIK